MIRPFFLFPTRWKAEIPYHPRVYFGIFVATLTLLSYFTLSLEAKLWLGLLGLALPFGLGVRAALEKKMLLSPSFRENEIFYLSPWHTGVFLGLLGFTRFYHLTSLPFWPLSDEGANAFLVLSQLKHWSWSLLWGSERCEPMMFWGLGGFFKLVPPSLLSLRLFPALVSLATVGASYWAARQYFTRSLSFIIAWLLAFSFWELTLSRTCILVILGPLFQCLCLGCLGLYLSSKNKVSKWVYLSLLGLLSGIGFYTWTNWAGIWLGLAALLVTSQRRVRGLNPLFFYLLLSSFTALPLAWAKLGRDGMAHIQSLAGWTFWKTAPSYLETLFWNGYLSYPYGSNWGGLLNPILGSLVLLGCLHLLRSAPKSLLYGAAACLSLAILPALIARGVEICRALPVMTLLILLASWGLLSLLSHRPKLLEWVFLGTLLLGSSALDLYNFTAHYSRIEGVSPLHQWRSVRYFNAYQSLQAQVARGRPLWIFSEFNSDYDNKTLEVADDPFNATFHPPSGFALGLAAVLVNANYLPCLEKDYPQCRSEWIPSGKEEEPLFAMVYIPLSQLHPGELEKWVLAERIYRDLDLAIKNKVGNGVWPLAAEKMLDHRNLLKGDRFLNSIYWEKTAFFKFLGKDPKGASEAYQSALREGYPAAHLYYDLAISQRLSGNIAEANKSFQKSEALSHAD